MPLSDRCATLVRAIAGNYLSACTKLGVPAHDSFQTVDLYENANLLQVVIQIHRLGSVAASRGFQGPTLGVKQATANAREFTEEQMRAGLNTQTFLGKGSNETAGAKLSMVETGRVQVRGNVAGTEGLGKGGEQTFIGTGSQVTTTHSSTHARSTHARSTSTSPHSHPTPPCLPPHTGHGGRQDGPNREPRQQDCEDGYRRRRWAGQRRGADVFRIRLLSDPRCADVYGRVCRE